ncbi:DUF1887 family CARF protein [Mahella sp.]|uniref:Card1-like endonuclease domain-containing protein n=1 Tax=Mahella sp. TaxID=2798721 RepID=UPI0025C68B6D|nr:DUF1887 family CARF protein [Mahella sp.]MBZ4665029.1 hypothetical protein [Mahella sp.]
MSLICGYEAVDELIVLVGSNPLPNYVAAFLLVRDGGTVDLVHTSKTFDYAENIKNVLKDHKQGLTFNYIEVDPSDKDKIYNSLNSGLLPQIGRTNNKLIGLNYTGGTKTMAVHTYDWVKGNIPYAVFSYLDSRKFNMLMHKNNDSLKSQKVLELVKIKIPELLALHGFDPEKVEKHMKSKPKYFEASKKMMEFMKSVNHLNKWSEWCRKNLKNGDEGKEEDQLKDVLIPEYSLKNPFIYLTNRDDIKTLEDVNTLLSGEEIANLAKWLSGGWLEDYTLGCVISIAKEYNITDYGMNIDVKNPRDFEFDVAFMMGYQLFGISCTTSRREEMCKKKIFEAYIRAQQMGGDEARIACVCYYNNPDDLKKEIENEIFEKGRIEVFGKDDVPELEEELKEWISTVGGK